VRTSNILASLFVKLDDVIAEAIEDANDAAAIDEISSARRSGSFFGFVGGEDDRVASGVAHSEVGVAMPHLHDHTRDPNIRRDAINRKEQTQRAEQSRRGAARRLDVFESAPTTKTPPQRSWY